jgi:hypothetical protein
VTLVEARSLANVEVWFRGKWRFAQVLGIGEDGWRRVRLRKDGREVTVAPYETRVVKFFVKS